MKQVKCPNCHKWSSSTETCEYCGVTINREKRALEKSGDDRKISAPKPPGKLQQFFEFAQKSNNPFVKILYYIIMSIWGVYVGVVVIILYIAVAASG